MWQGGRWQSPDPGPGGPVHVGSPSWQSGRMSWLLCGRNVPRRGPRETRAGPQHIRRPEGSAAARGRGRMGSLSILAPASLRKATQHISPQTCKTHGSKQPPWLPPSDLDLVAVCGRDQKKGAEEECRALRGILEPPFFCLLPPVDLLWATWCAALESRRNKNTAPASRRSQAEGGSSVTAPVRPSRHTLTSSVKLRCGMLLVVKTEKTGDLSGEEDILSRGNSSCKGPEAGGSVVRETKGP